MTKILVLLGLLGSVCAFAQDPFPIMPDSGLTPGSLCRNSKTLRYAEKIPYCKRSVSKGEKYEIIHTYDRELGYHIGEMDRQLFKIDHYIPLCMGGSNGPENLWPQHESVYLITDPLEQLLCEKMAEGKLRQREAIDFIKRAKADLEGVTAITHDVEAL